MRNEDAVTIARMLDSVISSRGGESLFDDDYPSDIGLAWIYAIERLDDAALATQAVAAIFETTKQIPTPGDLDIAYASVGGTPLPEDDDDDAAFKRPLPLWVRAWILARTRADMRLWPEQKDGYDKLQIENPSTRAYVWNEQGELMPDDARAKYEASAEKMTAQNLDSMLAALMGSRRAA